jgi:ABC-type dipeptide/oligopeptide/nickel transport system permease subunit
VNSTWQIALGIVGSLVMLVAGYLVGGTVAWYKGWDEGFREGFNRESMQKHG